MAEQQILCLKPAPRLEQVGDEHSERVQDRKHRAQGCDDSALRCESKAGWNFRKGQDEIARKINRIVNAIAEGTDTPALRQTLLTLEDEKAELENTFDAPCSLISAEPPTRPALAALFRRKVERLEEALNADPGITSAAAPILRNLIGSIILHPRENKGRMRIEVHSEPSTLFLPADGEPSDEKNWMTTVVAEEGLEPPTRGL
jgi:hypothetical protein